MILVGKRFFTVYSAHPGDSVQLLNATLSNISHDNSSLMKLNVQHSSKSPTQRREHSIADLALRVALGMSAEHWVLPDTRTILKNAELCAAAVAIAPAASTEQKKQANTAGTISANDIATVEIRGSRSNF